MIPAQRRRLSAEPRTEPIPVAVFVPVQRSRPRPDPALVRHMAAPPPRHGLAGGIAAVVVGVVLVLGVLVLLGVAGT